MIPTFYQETIYELTPKTKGEPAETMRIIRFRPSMKGAYLRSKGIPIPEELSYVQELELTLKYLRDTNSFGRVDETSIIEERLIVRAPKTTCGLRGHILPPRRYEERPLPGAYIDTAVDAVLRKLS